MDNENRIILTSAAWDMLEKIYKAVEPPRRNNELNAALAAAQAEFKVARRSKESVEYGDRYGDISDVVEASREALAKNGLSVTFPIISTADSGNVLECILMHSSGQQLKSSVRILPQKNDPRSYASEVSFMKRVLYTALTGVCVAGEDDDAHGAMDNYRDMEEKRIMLSKRVDDKDAKIPINREQLEDLEYELGGDMEIAGKLIDSFKLRDLANLPKSEYRNAIKTIRLIKDSKNRKK